MAISIVLADDHPVVRRGMQSLLESEPDFSIVGVAADGLEAVSLVERLKPDILVLDLMMPGLGGLEVLRSVRERVPRARVVVLSMHGSVAFISQALQNGAIGYVLKGCPGEILLRAVSEAAAGRLFLQPAVNEIAIDAYIEQSKAGPMDPHETLTPRQREVLQLVAEGKTNAGIAERLHISPRTIENHRSALIHKLGFQNHAELILYAIRHGMIPGEEG